ncbi:MAG: hypothetical protein D6750_01935 [Bacteroidetes bacterium]|nr:MAG: hypothetical protein D6750_01935 [Bacteroidota bacterium]
MSAGEVHLRRLRRIAGGVAMLFFLVIVAGVTVRVLGAGMGCPDWPTCYGQLIPPLRESELPPDYRQRYAVAGRLAEPFDPVKTWAEYLNRLISVVAGLGVVLLVGYTWLFLRGDRRLLLYVSLLPVLLLTQALLGWRVVATYLAEHLITAHMLFSVLLTGLVLWIWARTFVLRERPLEGEWRWYRWLGIGSWFLLLMQVLLGAGLRAVISQKGVEQGLETVLFFVHRSFSWFVLAGWAYFHWRVYREPTRQPLARRWAIWTTLALLVQVGTGAGMAYLAFSPVLQVVHLVSALFALNAGFLCLYFLRNTAYGRSNQLIPEFSA